MPGERPLARSPQLTRLSHDHHEALLFVWKIREGLRKSIPTQRINSFKNWFWKNHLQAHFETEEVNFAIHLPMDDEQLGRMIHEHQTIRSLLLSESNEDLAVLAKTLHDHIRFEERSLFPYIEQKLSQDELNQIGATLSHEPTCSSEWRDEFWRE